MRSQGDKDDYAVNHGINRAPVAGDIDGETAGQIAFKRMVFQDKIIGIGHEQLQSLVKGLTNVRRRLLIMSFKLPGESDFHKS